MDEVIKKRLGKARHTDEDRRLLDRCNTFLKESRSKMGQNYKNWDRNNDVYQGIIPQDEIAREMIEHQEPEKFAVPMTYAQVQTFAAFGFILLQQNGAFEFMPTGDEDYDDQELVESLIKRDMRKSHWNSLLWQNLLDAARFTIAPVKTTWVKESQFVPVELQTEQDVMRGMTFPTDPQTTTQRVTKFEGNQLTPISPYRFFPDTRLPLSRWMEGEFVGDEFEMTMDQLNDLQRDGIIAGVQHIEPMQQAGLDKRGATRLPGVVNGVAKGQSDTRQMVAITELQIKLVPKRWKLGEEEYQVKFVIRIANDNRILSIDRAGYVHDEWTYDVANFAPDMHSDVTQSLADTTYAIQDIITWLFNSRIKSINTSLENRALVDPSVIDTATLESRGPFIYTKKGSAAARLGVQKFYQQIPHTDTTQKNLDDADLLMRVMQVVTGVNENAMGQFHGGRRSATEARAVNSGAAARMTMTISMLFQDCYNPMACKMHINQRQGMSEDTFLKVLGDNDRIREAYTRFKPESLVDLVGSEDYFVFDQTTPSEKGFVAQSLQELAIAIISNPEANAQLGLDVNKLIDQVQFLRGVNNFKRFRTQPPIQPGIQNGGILPQPGVPATPPAVVPAQGS